MNDRLRNALLTSLALVAFAANSVLCRLALGRAAIDAAGFSTVRPFPALPSRARADG
jgi:hypothetical protein